MAIVLRSAKGSPLAIEEIDGNFTDIDGRVTTLEENPPVPNGIADIIVSGSQMTITLDDATVLGPFTIPRIPFRPAIVSTVATGTYAPVIGDANGYKRCTDSLGCVVTVPTNSSVAFPVDTEITFRQCGGGAVSFTPAGGVTINGVAGYLNETAAEGGVVTLKKVAENTWDLLGFLAEDVTA